LSIGVSYRQERLKLISSFLPTGRKTAQNFLDNALGLVISLVWRQRVERATLIGSTRGKDNAQMDAEKTGQIIRGLGGSVVAAEAEKWRGVGGEP
jgi:hypothetical protein